MSLVTQLTFLSIFNKNFRIQINQFRSIKKSINIFICALIYLKKKFHNAQYIFFLIKSVTFISNHTKYVYERAKNGVVRQNNF